MGVEGKSIPEIAALAAERKMRVDDVISMKEHDGWEYTGLEPRDGEAYVCSAYVNDKGKGGRCEGNHTFFNCDNPNRCSKADNQALQ